MRNLYTMTRHTDNTYNGMYDLSRINTRELYKQTRKSRIPISLVIHSVRREGRIMDIGKGLREHIRRWRNDYRMKVEGNREYIVITRTVQGRTFEASYTLGDIMRDGQLETTAERRRKAVEYIRQHIQDYRAELKRVRNPLFRRKPGELLKEYKTKELKNSKYPKDTSQYVGIEVECVTPRGVDLAPLIPFAKYVNVGTDGSVNHGNGEEGSEFRICLKREEIKEMLPQIMQAIKELGAKVNTSCGLHVHLDQRHQKDSAEVAKTFQKLVRSLGLLYTVVPKSRRKNTYCKRNREANLEKAIHGERYKAVNCTAYHRHKTLEVRLFGGTLEATKIINWIETLYAIAEGETILRCPKTFDTALKYWKLSDGNLKWLKERQAQFSELNATMPVSESETENNPHVMDEYAEDEEMYCDNCEMSGDHWTDDCQN